MMFISELALDDKLLFHCFLSRDFPPCLTSFCVLWYFPVFLACHHRLFLHLPLLLNDCVHFFVPVDDSVVPHCMFFAFPFLVMFSTVSCKCCCNVSSTLFLLLSFRFSAFPKFFIYCVYLVPFWTSYLHVRAARRIHWTISETDDSPITLGVLTLPRGAFWERSLVLCQVASRGAARHKYVLMPLKCHTLLFYSRWG